MPRKPTTPAANAAGTIAHVPTQTAAPSRSGAKVTVACKLPHGLLLRAFKMIEQEQPVVGGGMRVVQVAQQIGEPVQIHGYAAPLGMQPKCLVVGGFALTPNVDADFFEKWLKDNHDLDMVQKGLIKSYANESMAVGYAKEHGKLRNGLEPINPDKAAKDPRMPRGIETAKLTGDDAQAA